MIFLNLQDSLEIVIMFLSHYCNETKSDNLKLILNTLKKIHNSSKTNIDLINWELYLNQAKNNLQKSKTYPNIAYKNQSILFTEQEVFDAMILLLEENYKKSQADDIGGCLSDLAYCDYGETADPATAYFWQKFLAKVVTQKHQN